MECGAPHRGRHVPSTGGLFFCCREKAHLSADRNLNSFERHSVGWYIFWETGTLEKGTLEMNEEC